MIDSVKSFNIFSNQRTGASQRLNLVDSPPTEQAFETKQTLLDNQLSFSPESKKRIAHFVGKNHLISKGVTRL